ncbi:Na+/H+ antiporter NhaC family protein [Dysosmobacter sp.]|uniref:Na+/H+ antiporter NhaC family protein n=1 Tax=Dysosmobacter sp. TaxID=2591382 RepID=UPI002A867693|nr:Na+/H+ antiporter NhaC family protein [Dysosmobacter sp.]MDY3281619.1 Na+/H+ antiporter NhaC family protein [Dysosmobacter sp.]
MELLTLALFSLSLLLCILLDWSILYALAAGLVLFFLYGRARGFRWRELAQMALEGIRTVKNIIITFLLIGVLTALWRDAGTIPVIICYASRLISPPLFLLMAFLLNCLVSVLTGSSFGTVATMGVICATMASAMQMDLLAVGGAVLSGIFFGDRCSPVSTSALLISELTHTNIFRNIRNMLRSALVPFLVTCGFYTAVGVLSHSSGQLPDLQALFGRGFALSAAALLPAAVILLLSLLQVHVKYAMIASILTAVPICLFVQHTPAAELPWLMVAGYRAADPEIASMLNGGGIVSMLKVTAIICLSSSYSGIFQKTGLLDGLKQAVSRFSARTNPYAATLLAATPASMIACNQALAIMLTDQLCSQTEPDKERFALDLEDTAVVVSPLIPWSIACAVPLSSINAPTASVFFACFLYLLPLWRLVTEALRRRKGAA